MALLNLPLLIRGTVNPGVIAGTAVATSEDEKAEKNATPRGRIIAIVVAVVILIVVFTIAICYDRSKKRKARQGTKLRDLGEGGEGEEARPMVYGQAPVGRVEMQPTYHPAPGEEMYAGGGYAGGGYGQGPAPAYAPVGGQREGGYRG